ncbi:MAG TPA: ECF-type sigma factor, partial [Tahibacter sp.]|nr:ECF-type sigma factor [Tahibacter sp.]
MTNLSDADAVIEELLAGARQGQADASDRLFALLYEELRAQAHLVLRIGVRQTLCTTELVNETWLRLSGRALPVESRRHYCNLVARAMRQLLIDRARLRQAD